MKKKIIFNGFYGFKNTGDDAFVEIATWGNKHFWNNQMKGFVVGNDLPKTLNEYNRINAIKDNKFKTKMDLFKAAVSSDYFINVGGSVLGEVRPFENKSFANYSKIFNPKLRQGSIGVSIGPFKNSNEEKKVKEYLKKMEFLALRDSRSYEYAKSLSLDCEPIKAFDLAALLPEIFTKEKNGMPKPSRKTIGLSICNYERYYNKDLKNETRRNQFVKELLELLSKNEKAHFKFFNFNGHDVIGDERITHEIMSQLPQNRITYIPYLGNVQLVWDEIKTCDIMISTRLHASIFACYADVPFVLIEYHKKCSDFLLDIGYDPDLRVYDAQIPPIETAMNIAKILEGEYSVPCSLADTKERARLNFTKISL